MRVYREDAGFSQEQLAELLGVSRAYIADLEGDRRSISPALLERWRAAVKPRAAM